MCGFIFTHSKKQFTREELLNANTFIKFRGPTRTSIMSIQVKSGMHISMLHNLLDISGQQAEQPVMKDDSYLLFNGEIYNYKELNEASSDTYSLMNYYVTNGKFGDALDGEFVVLVYDSRECKLKVITDPFLTKPVFLGVVMTLLNLLAQVIPLHFANWVSTISLMHNQTRHMKFVFQMHQFQCQKTIRPMFSILINM